MDDSPGMSAGPAGNATIPLVDQSEIDSVQGRRDIAIVVTLILLAVPISFGIIRLFHPRRIRKMAVHDYFLFASMVFAMAATSGIVSELRFAIKPTTAPPGRGALSASIIGTMQFFGAVTLARMGALFFALREFGDKIRNPCRRTIINRIIIISLLVGTGIQGVIAIITTISSCTPPSSAWKPRRFKQDCKSYSQVQLVHAAMDVWKNTILIIMFVVMYLRAAHQSQQLDKAGRDNSSRHSAMCKAAILRYVTLVVAIITTFSGLARTIFIKRHISEIIPPLRLITPKILLSLEMNLSLTSIAILITVSAIRSRATMQEANMELAWQDPNDTEGNYYGPQAKAKTLNSAWDDLPDLQFQSDNPYNDFKRKMSRPLMLDQGTMTSPTALSFPIPPARAALRHRSDSISEFPAPIHSTAMTMTQVRNTTADSSSGPESADTLVTPAAAIPPLPFSSNIDSPLETPIYLQRSAHFPRHSTTSSASSSSLSSGPFSETEDEDEIEELVLQPTTYRPGSIVQHTRSASVAHQATLETGWSTAAASIPSRGSI